MYVLHNWSIVVGMFADEVPISAAFAFQKDSEFVHLFNHFLKKMMEAGVIFKINKDMSKNGHAPTPWSLCVSSEIWFCDAAQCSAVLVALILFCVRKPISNQGDYPQCQHST